MEPQPCVNHPGTQTRLSCAACDRPICPRCVRRSSVGQRCPDCAGPAASTRRPSRIAQYLRGGVPAAVLAVAGGIIAAQITFGSIILSAVIGFGVGKLMSWGAGGEGDQPLPQIAVGIALVGLALGFTAFYGSPLPPGPITLLAYPAAGWFAWRGVNW